MLPALLLFDIFGLQRAHFVKNILILQRNFEINAEVVK